MAGFDPVSWLFDLVVGGVDAYNRLEEQNKERVRDLFTGGHIKTGQDVAAVVQLGVDLRKERDDTAAELAAAKATHAAQVSERDARIAVLEKELAALRALTPPVVEKTE